MFLEQISMEDLAGMLAPHMKKPAWPGLTDPGVKARARRYAKKLGIWNRPPRLVDPKKEITVVPRSVNREFRRTGVRKNADTAHRIRLQELQHAALLLWLEHPAADADHLQDLIWAACERTTWIMSAHEGCGIDLGSSAWGRVLSEIIVVLDGLIEDEVQQRVRDEVRTRIFERAVDWSKPDWWSTGHNNWNHVCNANLITAALYLFRQEHMADLRPAATVRERRGPGVVRPAQRQLAAFIHPLIARLQYAVNGFTDDGGCVEGPGYWEYGFGHYLDAAVVLHHRTGGKLNIMDDEKIEKICRYPFATYIKEDVRTTFADSARGHVSADTALKINRFYRIPELLALVKRRSDGRPVLGGWRALSMYRGEKYTGSPPRRDHFLPDLGQVTMRTGRGRSETVLAAIAGRNNVSHNHNDIGSFMVYKKGRVLLTDPGAPHYTRKTFSRERYEILFCNSEGHSVPLVNGHTQPFGDRAYGKISVEGLNEDGPKRAAIDMTRAYLEDKTLRKLVRRFELTKDGTITMTDTYRFARKPKDLKEVFITYESARRLAKGRAVRIGAGASSMRLSTDVPGTFRVYELKKQSKEGRTGRILKRITFIPKKPAREMTLTFEMK